MSNARVVQNADRSPTRCAICHTHQGPFIDTQTSQQISGHLYICCGGDHNSGCLPQMARLIGMVDQPVHEAAMLEIRLLLEDNARLEQELEETHGRSKLLRDVLHDEVLRIVQESVTAPAVLPETKPEPMLPLDISADGPVGGLSGRSTVVVKAGGKKKDPVK